MHSYPAFLCCSLFWLTQFVQADHFEPEIRPLLNEYCADCHSGNDPSGALDLVDIQGADAVEAHFETWKKVVSVLHTRQMPPPDEPQPTDAQRQQIKAWYQARFVDNVQPRPGPFRPRRLSATEYRHTLRTLLGFELEVGVMQAEQTVVEKSLVMKLLQTDPPGKSGFRNDTHSNPLTSVLWDQYSYLVDTGLAELFSPARQELLEVYAGPIPESGFTGENAARLLRSFVPRAWRRPAPEAYLQQIVQRVQQSSDPQRATLTELKAVLMSPAFLYRGLLFAGQPHAQQAVDDFELAERLSYFIWADMPDEELTRLASQGVLSQPEVLRLQVARLLDAPQARNLSEDFAVQWLALDDIDQVSDETPYAAALKSQPIDFFQFLIAEDRPLLELIDSPTAFVNKFTVKFYQGDRQQLQPTAKAAGIEVAILPNQRLTLEQSPERGGMLTLPGILAMNRGPILRGTWLLERILGEHLPDPPADVGQVAANRAGEQLSFRQRFEQHRANPTCALCHDKIDPLGFALQAYDDSGSYLLGKSQPPTGKKRNQDSAEYHLGPIDTSGKLPSGEQFADFQGLQQILMTSQRKPVLRNIVQRMLSYALCRKLEYYDQPTVDVLVAHMDSPQGTYRELIQQIVASLPFQQTEVP